MTPALPPAAPAEATPAERLARSRDRIRESIAAVAPATVRLSGSAPSSATSAMQALLDKAMTVPGVAIVVDAMQSWWRYHPWRAVGAVAADAGRVAVGPVANRHPVVLVLASAVVGALLLRWGPWRWAAKRTLVAGFVPRLATRVAASVPMESWLSALAILRGKAASRESRPPSS